MRWTIAKCWSPGQIKLLRVAYEFAVQELDLKSNVSIRLAGRNHEHGFTIDSKVVIFYKDVIEEVVGTLFHELTHVSQFEKGKLYHNKNGVLIWKSGKHTSKNTAYCDQPWEIEAIKSEKILTDRFFSC